MSALVESISKLSPSEHVGDSPTLRQPKVYVPRDPVPRILLGAWAVLAAVSLVIPGASLKTIRGRGPVLAAAVPFLPFARVALAVWPHLPRAVQDFLEGNFRRYRWARQQQKHPR